MSDQINTLKIKCFDLQEANTGLSNYLVEIAKALDLKDINHIYSTVVGMVEENKYLRAKLEEPTAE